MLRRQKGVGGVNSAKLLGGPQSSLTSKFARLAKLAESEVSNLPTQRCTLRGVR